MSSAPASPLPPPPDIPQSESERDADRASFQQALKVGAPTWVGVAAWGSVVGIAMVNAGLSLPQALGMTLIVYAGSAQLSSLPLLAAHAPAWVIFVTALVVNLRFVIFSAILAPHFLHLPLRVRAWMGYLSGDVSIALFLQRYPDTHSTRGKLAYLKGLVYPNWLTWQVGSILGIVVGTQIPTSWGLAYAGTLALVCLLLPLMMNRAAVAGVLVAAVVAVLAHDFPYKLGLLVAVICGIVTSMAVEEGVKRWGQHE